MTPGISAILSPLHQFNARITQLTSSYLQHSNTPRIWVWTQGALLFHINLRFNGSERQDSCVPGYDAGTSVSKESAASIFRAEGGRKGPEIVKHISPKDWQSSALPENTASHDRMCLQSVCTFGYCKTNTSDRRRS